MEQTHPFVTQTWSGSMIALFFFKVFKKHICFELAKTDKTPKDTSFEYPCLQQTFSEEPSDHAYPYSEFPSLTSLLQVHSGK